MPPDVFEKEVDRCLQGLDQTFGVNLITIAPNYKAQFEVLRKKNVPFVVFEGSFPRKAGIQEMKKANIAIGSISLDHGTLTYA